MPLSLPSLSNEETILINSIKFLQSKNEIDTIKSILSNKIDWDHLKVISEIHGLKAILYPVLSCDVLKKLVPLNVLEDLEKFYKVNSMWNKLLFDRLSDILNSFYQNDISAVTIKGPVLGFDLYGDISLRQFSDLDIMVKHSDIHKAKALLLSIDYKLDFFLPKDIEPYYERHSYYYNLVNEQDEMSVDLHWNLIPDEFSFSISTNEILKTSKNIAIDNKTFSVINDEYLLIYFCLHGAKHGWSQLNWISDLAQLIKTKEIDWNVVIKVTEDLDVQEMVYLGIKLAKELFEIELHDEVKSRIAISKRVEDNYGKTMHMLFPKQGNYPGHLKIKLYYMSLMPYYRDKLYFIHDSVLKPTAHECSLVALPSYLYFLYYLIRPSRLIVKYLKRFLLTK